MNVEVKSLSFSFSGPLGEERLSSVHVNGEEFVAADEVDARIEAAVAAERERCARIADLHAKAKYSGMASKTEVARLCARSIATAIRDPRAHSGAETAPETQDE